MPLNTVCVFAKAGYFLIFANEFLDKWGRLVLTADAIRM